MSVQVRAGVHAPTRTHRAHACVHAAQVRLWLERRQRLVPFHKELSPIEAHELRLAVLLVGSCRHTRVPLEYRIRPREYVGHRRRKLHCRSHLHAPYRFHHSVWVRARMLVRARARACVCACKCACVRVCVCLRMTWEYPQWPRHSSYFFA